MNPENVSPWILKKITNAAQHGCIVGESTGIDNSPTGYFNKICGAIQRFKLAHEMAAKARAAGSEERIALAQIELERALKDGEFWDRQVRLNFSEQRAKKIFSKNNRLRLPSK